MEVVTARPLGSLLNVSTTCSVDSAKRASATQERSTQEYREYL